MFQKNLNPLPMMRNLKLNFLSLDRGFLVLAVKAEKYIKKFTKNFLKFKIKKSVIEYYI
jgi:hypothetical protein